MLYDYSFFSAPQLERDPLGGAKSKEDVMADNPSDAFPPGSPLSFINEGLAAGRRLSARAAAGRSPFMPPPGLARVLLRLKCAAGVGGANILNQEELFTGGYCEAC